MSKYSKIYSNYECINLRVVKQQFERDACLNTCAKCDSCICLSDDFIDCDSVGKDCVVRKLLTTITERDHVLTVVDFS